jgi:hypothetical protein
MRVAHPSGTALPKAGVERNAALSEVELGELPSFQGGNQLVLPRYFFFITLCRRLAHWSAHF